MSTSTKKSQVTTTRDRFTVQGSHNIIVGEETYVGATLKNKDSWILWSFANLKSAKVLKRKKKNLMYFYFNNSTFITKVPFLLQIG
jgi:hypothetical protein